MLIFYTNSNSNSLVLEDKTIADLECDDEKTKQTLIHKDKKWKYTYLNPSPLTIRGLIKIHKTYSSVRSIVNWKNAPAHKLATKLFQ